MLKVATLKTAKRLYRQNKHYSLHINHKDAIVSGPQKVIIKDGAAMISANPGSHNKINPHEIMSCINKGDNQVKFVNIYTLILIDDY